MLPLRFHSIRLLRHGKTDVASRRDCYIRTSAISPFWVFTVLRLKNCFIYGKIKIIKINGVLIVSEKVITLCGSAKYKEDIIRVSKELTLLGNIVLMPVFDFTNDELDSFKLNILKELHYKRIELADEILVINKNGYIGTSTKAEIKYAAKLGKKINYMEN